mgnify:CR=1 FL=1
MDKKTNIKVINNMAERIEALDDKIKRLDISAYNNLANLEIDVNARLEKLEKINLLNADRNIKNMEHFEKIVDKIEVLENNLITGVSTLKSHVADSEIKIENNMKSLNERCDDLEAKNFVVKRDVDTVIEEHEMFLKQLEDKFINNNKGGNNE